MASRVLILLVFAAVHLVTILVAVPLWQRRVPPNGLYGLRVPATFADEWVWYEANARSGQDLMTMGLCLLLLAVGLFFVSGFSDNAYAIINAVFMGIAVFEVLVHGWRRANRLLRERRTAGASPVGRA